MRVLLLGGTAEARALAAALLQDGHEVVSSLAGRVSRPRMPAGEVRVGGFGGAQGLRGHLEQEGVDRLVDATHPFAATMTRHAVQASRASGVPCLRLARPGWSQHRLAGSWHWVAGHDEARQVAGRLGERAFLTTGRQTLSRYLADEAWRARRGLARVVEPLDEEAAPGGLPPGWEVVLDRGPYDLAGELALMASRGVDVLVTKDSGGAYTAAKLDAAEELAVPVVIVRRPPTPEGLAAVESVEQARAWVGRPLRPGP